MAAHVDNGGFGKNWSDKLRLLDAIDDMREPIDTRAAATAAAASVSSPSSVSALGAVPASFTVAATAHSPHSQEALLEKLHMYEQTCAMLESEVQVLEQQTMTALAEAARLRRELDRSRAEKNRGDSFLDHAEKTSVSTILRESEHERRLLLDALENSEAELARMVKTLDLVARKMQVA